MAESWKRASNFNSTLDTIYLHFAELLFFVLRVALNGCRSGNCLDRLRTCNASAILSECLYKETFFILEKCHFCSKIKQHLYVDDVLPFTYNVTYGSSNISAL